MTATLIGDGENNLIQGKVKMIPTSKAAFFEITILSDSENGCVEIGLISPPSYVGSNDVESLPMKTKPFYRSYHAKHNSFRLITEDKQH